MPIIAVTMSTPEADADAETRVTRKSQRNASSPEKSASTDAGKKESFQWSTPADEFADDVGSDIEDMGEERLKEVDDLVEDAVANQKGVAEVNEETGDIIIRLGEDEVNKYSVSESKPSITNNTSTSPPKKSKKAKSKQQFPCPKCDKVWNWPWELRRHLIMHFKEVILFSVERAS